MSRVCPDLGFALQFNDNTYTYIRGQAGNGLHEKLRVIRTSGSVDIAFT